MLRALILDFDGVVVDSEPVILQLTQEMAAMEGWKITEEEYYRDYLAFDDRTIVEHLYSTHGKPISHERISELVGWKAHAYEQIIQNGLPAMPGAVAFIRRAYERYPLAIASGSLRQEIEQLLSTLQLRDKFQVLATADDCLRSKPDPEIYLKALDRLRELPDFHSSPLQPSECLAIEDAPGGIRAARAAGLKCLALAHSRPAEELHQADWVFHGFPDFDIDQIARQFD